MFMFLKDRSHILTTFAKFYLCCLQPFQGKSRGQNWMTGAAGSLHSASAKVGVGVEAAEVAATTLADSFSSHACCS